MTFDACPCCGAQASASPHAELRFACDVCGGPRVPRLDPAIQYGPEQAAMLRKADEARKARGRWRGGAIGCAVLIPMALLLLGVVALLFGASIVTFVVALAMVAPMVAFLAFAAVRGAARGREIAPALDAAWLAAARDVARQTRGLTAPALAQKLGIGEAQAEELMALLDVDAATMGGAGTPPKPPQVPGVRIDAAEGEGAGFAESEEEAALAERIEAAARARLGPGGKP